MTSPDTPEDAYSRWIATHDTLSDQDRDLIRDQIRHMPWHPLISVVMPVYDTNEALLRQAIGSVKSQLYPYWELCIADDASPRERVREVLREEAADGRVRWVSRPVNGHISAASNTAIGLARGEFIALMDHDDLLAERALYEVALELARHPDADVIYSDEDRVDGAGNRSGAYFKPGWSPELLSGHNVISHLGAYRRSLVEQLGGFRLGYEGSQDWDLALRATAATTPDRIRHIPAVLYHWRWKADAPSFSEAWAQRCQDAGRAAVMDWLAAAGVTGASIEPAPLSPNANRVVYPLPDPLPFVSVIVPTRDRAGLLETACRGVLEGTNWPPDRLELIIVDNDSREAATLALLARLRLDPRVRVIRDETAFNYSRLNNLAAAQARGDVLALLNNDIEVTERDWLAEMVRLAWRRQVGVVGAKLLYPDGRLQHGGAVMGPEGFVGHLQPRVAADDGGFVGQLALTRALSLVTGACMVLRRDVYDEVGGLDEALGVSFNDSDLCLRVQDRGYRVVWTPSAVLVHHESATRGSDQLPHNRARAHEEWQFMVNRWGSVLDDDPFHNPNILLHEGGGPLYPAPSRRIPPWRRPDALEFLHEQAHEAGLP